MFWNSKWKRRIASAIVAVIVLAMLGGTLVSIFSPAMSAQTKENYVFHGVSVEGIDLGGMGIEQAQRAVEDYLSAQEERTITLFTETHSEEKRVSELGVTYQVEQAVTEAYQLGKTGNVIARYKDIKDIENGGVSISIPKTVDVDVFRGYLEKQSDEYVRKPQEPYLTRDENRKFVVHKEQIGQSLDMDAAVEAFATYIEQEWDGEDAAFELQVILSEPKHKAEELKQVKDKLGTYTTNYSTSSESRKTNIKRAAKLIHGMILYPGEEFSTSKVIGPINADNGYEPAGSYMNGMVVDSYGGGVCQVSTTLYNAVIRAELEVTERHNHTMTVSYVPLSADAAIAEGSMDFCFKNNLKQPVYLATDADGTELVISIYGMETRAKNRDIQFRSETLAVYEPDSTPIYIQDASMKKGEQVTIQNAITGYKAQYYKDIYIDGEKKKSVLLNTSVYSSEPARVRIGTAKPEKKEKRSEEEQNETIENQE
ncbi:MAG: VanW family protein [Lachnospiraceae bacterium]